MKLSFLQILTEIWDKNPQFWEVRELWDVNSELQGKMSQNYEKQSLNCEKSQLSFF